jgi:hypothetical protein
MLVTQQQNDGIDGVANHRRRPALAEITSITISARKCWLKAWAYMVGCAAYSLILADIQIPVHRRCPAPPVHPSHRSLSRFFSFLLFFFEKNILGRFASRLMFRMFLYSLIRLAVSVITKTIEYHVKTMMSGKTYEVLK